MYPKHVIAIERGGRETVASVHSERYKHLLKRLKKARLEAGLTQVQVAEALRQPQSFVSKCESGERRVDAVELDRFAELYGKPVSFFLPKDQKD